MVEVTEADVLLSPDPLPLEMGVQRLASGQLHVAARTDMPGCTGEMFEWWFRFAPDTEQYSWWHPLDHVSSDWTETSATTHIGSTHIVDERLSGSDVHSLLIHFRDPTETFSEEALANARAGGDVSGLVCAHLGMSQDAPRDELGRPLGGRMCHIARDTPFGMVLRSRFWMGAGLPIEPEQLSQLIPVELGLQLMQHAHTEFKYLARFLPSLYAGAHPDSAAAALPW